MSFRQFRHNADTATNEENADTATNEERNVSELPTEKDTVVYQAAESTGQLEVEKGCESSVYKDLYRKNSRLEALLQEKNCASLNQFSASLLHEKEKLAKQLKEKEARVKQLEQIISELEQTNARLDQTLEQERQARKQA